jgi:hypothetical protein
LIAVCKNSVSSVISKIKTFKNDAMTTFRLFGIVSLIITIVSLESCKFHAVNYWNVDDYTLAVADLDLVTPNNAGEYIGKEVRIIGEVVGVHSATEMREKPIFLNLDKNYPNNEMTVVIYQLDADRMGFRSDIYEHKRVQINGIVDQYTDEAGKVRPSIRIFRREQIKMF